MSAKQPTNSTGADGKSPLTPPAEAVASVRHPEAPAPGQLLGSHYEQCFGCGGEQGHGLHLATRAGQGVDVTAEFTVQPAHQGAPGLAHGGVLTAALDETMGALQWLMQTVAVTARLETEFVRPVPVDTLLHLEAAVRAVHRRKIYAAATGRSGGPDGPVVARAEALFVAVQIEHFTRHGRDEEIQAAMDDPDMVRRARAFEVNP